jgi:methylglyoxal synthase
MDAVKTVALVAHDNRKKAMVEWVEFNWHTLAGHRLVCTGTTGRLVEEAISAKAGGTLPEGFSLTRLKSGPLGGDQQLGAMIADGRIDVIMFFWDPMSPHPHDVDVKALLRIAVLYDVPMACNRSTADFLISSPLMEKAYSPAKVDFSGYIDRELPDKANP